MPDDYLRMEPWELTHSISMRCDLVGRVKVHD